MIIRALGLPAKPAKSTQRAPHPYTYMRTYVHHEFGLTGEAGRAGGGGGGGREGGRGWAKYCTCQQFGTKKVTTKQEKSYN